MNREQLSAIQVPLKSRYKQDPKAAVVTFRAVGRISEGIACTVETGSGPVEAGLHPATGGDGTLACSADLLLEALVACAGVTLQAVAVARGIELRDARIVAEGDLDLQGTLALSKDAPVGFPAIRLRFELDSDAPDETLDRLMEATERYCVVFQTLRQPVDIRSTRTRRSATSPA